MMMSCAIDAKENRHVAIADILGAFLHAVLDKEVYMLLEGKIAELIVKLDPKLHMWKWHIRLNHLPFIKIKFMVVRARIPKELHKAKTPFGPTCAFIKATSEP